MTNEEREMTIDYLEGMKEKYIEGEGYERHPLPEWYALDKAIKLLEQTRWVPVSERSPEEEDLYLVTVKNEHDRRYSKTCWFHGDGNWFARQDVIAWRPLPESYKESEDK